MRRSDDAAGRARQDPDDLRNAVETTRGQLMVRGATVLGDESPEDLAALSDAVDLFEARRRAIGGDSYTNDPASSQPDDPALVLPTRWTGEAPIDYARRVRAAAEQIPRNPPPG